MTTKVIIEADTHGQQKAVRVEVSQHGKVHTTVDLKTGEKTEQHVYLGQTIAVSEIDIQNEQAAPEEDGA